jgi:hypothetical protein
MGVSPRALKERVSDWLYAPQPVHALVIGRIVFGMVLFLCYLVRLPDVQALYGPDGVGEPSWFQRFERFPESTQVLARGLEALLPDFSAGAIWLAYTLLLISSLCFAIGFRTRSAGALTWLLSQYFVLGRMPAAYWGWPFVLHAYLLYVVFSPAGRFLSVDDWLRRRGQGEPPRPASEWVTPAWPLRLLQVHLCTVYLTAGWSRIDDPGWLKGRGIYIAVTNMLHSKWVIDWQPFKVPLMLMSYGVFVLEPAAPILLWVRRVGPIIAYLLIAMHLGLEVISNVGWWSFTMIPGLLSFVPRAHLDAVLSRLPGGPELEGTQHAGGSSSP